jgi:hypothetical protein
MSARSDATQLARRSLASLDASRVLGLVDQLDLRPAPGVNPVSLVPLKSLRQKRDVNVFAKTAPIASVALLLEVIGGDALEAVVEHLGDHAENPSLEQLTAAVTAAQSGDITSDEVLAMFAYAVVAEFPAAPHCRALLEESGSFTLTAWD